VILAFVLAAAVALGVAAGVAFLIARNASRLGLLDVPNERSSHPSSIPRGGGTGIVAGVAAGTAVLWAFGIRPGRDVGILVAGAGVIGVLGAIDDLYSVRARYRFAVQVLVAVAVVALIGDVKRLPLPPPFDIGLGWLGAPLAVVWLVAITNFYNFMDGIDGLAAGQTIASCAGVAIAVWSAGAVELALVLAAATIGFLLFNLPPARLFLGDIGSTSLGFAIAGLPLLAPTDQRPAALFGVGIGLALFILDPLETLLRRLRAGKRLGTAHRGHSYQLLASTRERQPVVALAIVLAGLALSIGGGIAYRAHWLAWPLVALALVAFGVERFLAGRTRGVAPRVSR
jgi:UDP-N-acetylmuramyl pentapeptide phosphotransferase/UDP-N-acetylglucosamine-1-phosphate transferase